MGFKMPGGILSESKELIQDFEVNGITGFVQSQAVSLAKTNPGSAIVSLIKNSLRSIGSHSSISDSLVNSLLVGDSDVILLALYGESYPGEPLSMEITCGGCSKKFTSKVFLEDVSLKPLASDKNSTHWQFVEDGSDSGWAPGELLIVNDSRLAFRIKLGKFEATFRYPTLGDSIAVSGSGGTSNPIELRHKLYARCCIGMFGDEGGRDYNVLDFAALPAYILEFIDDAFSSIPPGPDGPIISTCTHCGHENEAELDARAFLYRLLARSQSTKRRSGKRLNSSPQNSDGDMPTS